MFNLKFFVLSKFNLKLLLFSFFLSVTVVSHSQNIEKYNLVERKKIFLLGEIHDNPNGHNLRLDFVMQLIREGQKPIIAMEQFDRENQSSLDLALSSCRDVDCVLKAAGTPGWEWRFYEPYVRMAIDKQVTLIAANTSNDDIRRVITNGFAAIYNSSFFNKYNLNQLPASLVSAQAKSIQDGHCNMLPSQAIIHMVQGQIARDIWMASVIDGLDAKTIILLAGNGHVRKDAGVFQWLSQKSRDRTEVHGYTEQSEKNDLDWFDITHVMSKIDREDPCLEFQKHLNNK